MMNKGYIYLLPLLLIFTTQVFASKCELTYTKNWLAQYSACPSSAVAAYNAVLVLYYEGKTKQAKKLLSKARRVHPQFAPLKLLSKDMASWSLDPYALIGELTDRRMQAWVAQLPPPEPFNGTLPEREEMPPLPELVKDEFETTAMFKERVQRAQDYRERKRKQIEDNYSREVETYNNVVRAYNDKLARDKEERPQKIAAMQRKIMGESIGRVMGQPGLKDLVYNADKQEFYARLISEHDNFNQSVRFEASLQIARELKHNADSIVPDVEFEIIGGRLHVKDINVPFRGRNMSASLTSQSYSPQVLTATLDDGRIETAYTQLKTMTPTAASASGGEEVFFSTALSLEADPELARLKQQQAELTRKQAEAGKQRALAAERKRLQAQIMKQQQALAMLGGSAAASSYKGLKMLVDWSFKQSSRNNSDTLMVIIGNRNYQKGVPVVH